MEMSNTALHTVSGRNRVMSRVAANAGILHVGEIKGGELRLK